MSVRVKICGITRFEDARVAAHMGVDALGFIFVKKSPRYIEPKTVAAIVKQLPPFISRVGVFVDEERDTIVQIAREAHIDTIQLHGSETTALCRDLPFPVIKSLAAYPDTDLSLFKQYPVAGILLDTWNKGLQGGTGMCGDWAFAKKAAQSYDRIILAGGLCPANLLEALSTVQPHGVDINSGVEVMPGIKNPHKIREALRIIRNWQTTQ